eukprot:Em0008g21a
MSGNTCIVCQSTRCNEPLLKFYRIPPDLNKRALSLRVLHLSDHILKPHYRVCSKHFRDGDPKNGPELLLGKKFATPVKRNDARTTRSILRQKKELQTLSASTSRMDPDSPHLSTLPQPSIMQPTVDAQPLQPSNTLDVNIDEPNLSMSSLSCATSEEPNLDALSPTPVVDELPSCSYTSMQLPLSSATTVFVDSALQEIPAIIHRSSTADNEQYKLNSALIARVEILEAENAKLKNTISKAKLTLTSLARQVRDYRKFGAAYLACELSEMSMTPTNQGDEFGFIEFKCPFVQRDLSPLEASLTSGFAVDKLQTKLHVILLS